MSASRRPAGKGFEAEHYKGREHAEAKHHILETYLRRLLIIVGGRFEKIAYIDCFAGPWGSQSDDLSDTSPGIALRTMQECRDALASREKFVRMRALFIESDAERCEQLKQFLAKVSTAQVSGEVRCDEFQKAATGLVNWIERDEFAFAFVDPFGWKDVIAPATLLPMLQRPKTELMINFMSSFIRMATPHASQEKNLLAIFGEGYRDLDEQGRVDRYRAKVKLEGATPGLDPIRTASLQIDHASKDSAVYFIIYVTRNARGLLTFLEEAEKTDKKQQSSRHQRRMDVRKQDDLFGAESLAVRPVDRTRAVDAWMTAFPAVGVPVQFSAELMADIAEAAGCPLSVLYQAGMDLLASAVLQNLDAKGKRQTRPVYWEKGERMVRLQ